MTLDDAFYIAQQNPLLMLEVYLYYQDLLKEHPEKVEEFGKAETIKILCYLLLKRNQNLKKKEKK